MDENPYKPPRIPATRGSEQPINDSNLKLIPDRVLRVGCVMQFSGWLALVAGSFGLLNVGIGLLIGIPLMILIPAAYLLTRIRRQRRRVPSADSQ